MQENKQNTHGGNIYRAQEIYGVSRDDILDYSANINPLGLPQSLKQTIISSINELVNYPDPECTALKTGISDYLGVQQDAVVIGNGASEVIFLLFDVLRPKKLLIVAPTFSEYERAAYNAGVEVEYFELREKEEYGLDVSRMFSKISEDIDAVFICNPNNPTSTLTDRACLLELIKYICERNIYVFIDETFIELTPAGNKNSVVDVLYKFSNLFIIRAFTKVFAIPGLRLGYGLGNKDIVTKMWERKLPWSVNSFACNMGGVLQDEQDYMSRTCAWIATEKEWFYNQLCKIERLKAFEPQTNFVLVKILDEALNAGELRDRMAAMGILIRDASNFEFLNHKFFRVAIKDRESNIKFMEILNQVLQK